MRRVVPQRLQVVEVDPAAAMGNRAYGHDSRRVHLARGTLTIKGGNQLTGKGKVAKHVGSEQQFESVPGLESFGRSVQARIVDEAVHRRPSCTLLLRRGTYGVERGEVKQDKLRDGGCRILAICFDSQPAQGVFSAGAVAAKHYDLSTVARKLDGCAIADSAIGARNQEALASLRRHLCRVPLLSHCLPPVRATASGQHLVGHLSLYGQRRLDAGVDLC